MPPVIENGSGHRIIAVGLYAPDPRPHAPAYQLVGVDLETGDPVVTQPLHLGDGDCIAPLADVDCEDTGQTGQAEILVTQDGVEL